MTEEKIIEEYASRVITSLGGCKMDLIPEVFKEVLKVVKQIKANQNKHD